MVLVGHFPPEQLRVLAFQSREQCDQAATELWTKEGRLYPFDKIGNNVLIIRSRDEPLLKDIPSSARPFTEWLPRNINLIPPINPESAAYAAVEGVSPNWDP